MPNDPKRRYRTPGAADYVRVAASTLAKYRITGLGPRYSKAGPRIVVYDEDDLDAWLTARSRHSTSSANTKD
jgi:hypothetical protein